MLEDKLTLEQVMEMELYPIIVYAGPIMVALVIAEYYLRLSILNKESDTKDMWAAAWVGIGNLISSAFTKTLMFATVLVFYNLAPIKIPNVWWAYILCIIPYDFCRYWAHRVAHEQRFWWATHVTHHSSEQYTWTISFRLSWVQQLKVLFFLPVALMGFHPVTFFIIHQLGVLYQFWIHTELIKKLPAPIEYIFVTPSHHRVHHGTNVKYIDKNYGSTFIIWDRLFGTFQPEEETPNYGILTPVNSYNPVYLVFHEFIAIGKDMKNNSIKKWPKILFGSPNQVLSEEQQEELKIAKTKKAA